jgi:serine/threonine-protein kinase HipA
VSIGNNDAHAKNVALLHLATGTKLSQVYDALPNLFHEGLVKWDLVLAIDGVFDHRRMSVERIVAEAKSWSVVTENRAEVVVGEALTARHDAIGAIERPKGVSTGVVERLQWNMRRLLAGPEISEPKR